VERKIPSLLTRKQAAKRMNISHKTLEKHASTGMGPPFVKIFGRTLYEESDIDEFIAERKCRNTREARALRLEGKI